MTKVSIFFKKAIPSGPIDLSKLAPFDTPEINQFCGTLNLYKFKKHEHN